MHHAERDVFKYWMQSEYNAIQNNTVQVQNKTVQVQKSLCFEQMMNFEIKLKARNVFKTLSLSCVPSFEDKTRRGHNTLVIIELYGP